MFYALAIVAALLLVGRHALDRYARWRRVRRTMKRVARGFPVLPAEKD